MTFELSDPHRAVRDRARAFARSVVDPRAADIDRTAAVPPEMTQVAQALVDVSGGDLCLVVVAEEIATASGALALLAMSGAKEGRAPLGLSGLRGASSLDDSPRTQLVLAAVAVGLGRAAVEAAIADLRAASASAGQVGEKPHWAMADVATEVEAARLMTYRAASRATRNDTEIAMARLVASIAAQRAADTASRIAGPDASRDGAALERIARDVRAVVLVLGTEDQQRARAAEGLLPQ